MENSDIGNCTFDSMLSSYNYYGNSDMYFKDEEEADGKRFKNI